MAVKKDIKPNVVKIDFDKLESIFGFKPSTIYVAGKEVTFNNSEIEVTPEQLEEVKDFIVG